MLSSGFLPILCTVNYWSSFSFDNVVNGYIHAFQKNKIPLFLQLLCRIQSVQFTNFYFREINLDKNYLKLIFLNQPILTFKKVHKKFQLKEKKLISFDISVISSDNLTVSFHVFTFANMHGFPGLTDFRASTV